MIKMGEIGLLWRGAIPKDERVQVLHIEIMYVSMKSGVDYLLKLYGYNKNWLILIIPSEVRLTLSVHFATHTSLSNWNAFTPDNIGSLNVHFCSRHGAFPISISGLDQTPPRYAILLWSLKLALYLTNHCL